MSEPSLEPRALRREIEFVLDHVARYLARPPGPPDITSVFAGLRPLVVDKRVRRTAAISRDYAVTVSRSGLVTVIGGKWTIYRKMGEAAVDRAAMVAGLPKRDSRTRELRLHGWIEQGEGEEVWAVYGADAGAIRELIKTDPALGERLHSRFPYLKAHGLWAVRHEMARTVEDVLARRTRALFLDAQASLESAPVVAQLLAKELGRDTAWQQDQLRLYSQLAGGYRLA